MRFCKKFTKSYRLSLCEKNYAFAFSAAFTITANAGALSDAPPTNAPSMSGFLGIVKSYDKR
ncbi:hypothetical protein HPSH465_1210 [Glaesserella parasuis H465]|nr:hypothetical protein HPSH465_1210 [Glaesserella parasuis H465]